MNKIKKCSISGIAFTLEESAYNRLSEYLDSLKRAYKNSPESDEIIADIEARIAELILSAQSDATQIVCLPIIENIIAQMGSAEDISDSDNCLNPTTEPTTSTRIVRRLYRDTENGKLGGVCAGLGKYFGVDPVLIRLAIFSPLILVPISNLWYKLSILGEIGKDLFWVLIMVYLIMWLVVPKATTARQKLEMEGEPVTAKSIADHSQNPTDEERAKSSVASFVARLGKIAVVLLKVFVALLIFPLVLICTVIITAIFSIITGLGTSFIHFGNLGTLSDAISNFGCTLPMLSAGMVLIPTIVIIYLLVVLIIGKTPKWWVLIVSLVVWIALIISSLFATVDVVSNLHGNEIERILKDNTNYSQPMDSQDSLEYNRLLNDPNVESID